MSNAATKQENRAHPRRHVRWSAYWSDGRRARTGEIRDVSRHGLFLSPAWRPSTGYAPGDEIEVRCALDDRSFDVRAIVAWSGVSRTHGCEGLGLRVLAPQTLDILVQCAGQDPS